MTEEPSPQHSPPQPETRRVLLTFAPMIYGPTVLYSLGEGALYPLVPVLASKLGANLSQAALLTAVIVVARLLGNLPAGWLVSRIGERWSLGIAASSALLAVTGLFFAQTLPFFAAGVFVLGMSGSVFGLARHTFMTLRAPLPFRARALSLLGGSFRLGTFLGPFMAAIVLSIFPEERAAAVVFGCALILVLCLLVFARDPEQALASPVARFPSEYPASISARSSGRVAARIPPETALPQQGVFRTMWQERRVLRSLWLSASALSALRQARVHMLPLWGLSLALDSRTLTLIIGVAGALEFLLFYASGQIMDRWGRRWASVPTMLVMGTAFLTLAITSASPNADVWFFGVAIIIGIANGLSSGILMTLGADAAPPESPAAFLSSWRMLSDTGAAASPIIVAGVSAGASLAAASGVIGVIGLLGAVGMFLFVPQRPPVR